MPLAAASTPILEHDPHKMKHTHTRITACIQNDSDHLVRQARMVEEADVESIKKVFKTFRIEYEVEEISSNTRLYSLAVSLRNSYIFCELLTQKELISHLTPFVGKDRILDQEDLKKLLKGKVSEICKTVPGGEIVIGYELTIRKDEAPFKFPFPRLRFRKKEAESLTPQAE